MPYQPDIALEHDRPQLVSCARLVRFRPTLAYLKNSETGKLLKLSSQEADLVALMDGETALPDILQGQLQQSGTAPFQTLLDLLTRLQSDGFLQSGDATAASGENSSRGVTGPLFSYDLLPVHFSFRAAPIRQIASLLSSWVGLGLLAITAVAGILSSPYVAGLNMLKGINVSPNAPATLKYGVYLIALAGLWISISLILSLKSMFSAYVLTSNGCDVIRPRIRFAFGLVFFDCDITDIVLAGPSATLRLMASRFLLPLVLAAGTLPAWQFAYQVPFVLLFRQVCFVVAFFSLCPLCSSDLSRSLGLLTLSGGSLRQQTTFLASNFLRTLLDFRAKPLPQDYYHMFVSSLAIAWLYFFYAWFWHSIEGDLVYLVADLTAGSLAGATIAVLYLALLALPLVGVAAASVSITVLNIGVMAQTPLGRMRRAARRIAGKGVPAKDEVVGFLHLIPLFSDLDSDGLRGLCERLRLLRVKRGADIVVQGERGDTFYVIITGRCRVLKRESSGRQKVVEVLTTGDSFGETALIDKVPRTATVRAVESCALLQLDRKCFEEFVLQSTAERDKVTDLIRVGKLIMATGIFSYLSPRQVSALVLQLQRSDLGEGKVVFEQGDPGDRFYLIKEGSVLVRRTEEGKVVMEKRLARGDHFGEIALIKNVPRTARVVATTNVSLLSLTKAQFYELLGRSLATGVALDEVADERMARLGKEVAAACS